MEDKLGDFCFGNRSIEIDAEHALAAQCVFGESGQKFTKLKRTTHVAVQNLISWPSDKDVRELEKRKPIGELPQILGDGGRYNTIEGANVRYLMSQAFVAKSHDIFFKIEMTVVK